MKVFRSLFYSFLISLLVISIFSCGPATQGQLQNEESEIDEQQEVVIEEKTEEIPEEAISEPVIIPEESLDKEMVNGYRIKVASVDSMEEADLIEKKVVENLNEAVYIDYIVERYMIYVGDCQDKEEADKLKNKLKELGFERIYAVPKSVYKRELEASSTATETEETSSDEEYAESPSEETPVIKSEKMLGYRVQVFAGSNRDNAIAMRNTIMNDVKEKIYIVEMDGYYKVQIGDFKARIDAEQLKNSIINVYEGAFIQKSWIFLGSDNDTAIETTSNNNVTPAGGTFFIQIGAFASKNGAEQFKGTVEALGFAKCLTVPDKNLFKVVLGAYPTRKKAEEVKNKLISYGFDGAWIYEQK